MSRPSMTTPPRRPRACWRRTMSPAHRGVGADRRDRRVHLGAADGLGDVLPVPEHGDLAPARPELEVGRGQERRQGRLRPAGRCRRQRGQGQGPVHGAGVDVQQAEAFGQGPRGGGLARTGRAVDGDHRVARQQVGGVIGQVVGEATRITGPARRRGRRRGRSRQLGERRRVRDWPPSLRASVGCAVGLDQQAVGPGGDRGPGQGRHVAGIAGGVAGIDDHRQVGALLEHDHRAQVQGVAQGRFEGADAPLAEDQVAAAGGQHVLGGAEPLVDGGHHAALQQDRLAAGADLPQQGEILHAAAADLQHVGAGGHLGHVPGVEHLGDHGQPGAPSRAAASSSSPAGPRPWKS